MNWDALGAISELTAALAFLVSFLFVGHQLRQNLEMERASNQREILNQARSFFSLTRSDLRILVAVSECMRDYATANQEKKHIFNMWVVDYMLLAEQAWYMRRDGYINAASYDGFENLCLAMFATEGGQAVWPSLKASWGRDASEHFEKRLLESAADSPKLYDLLPYL
ncbi:MAG: hypothetical protein CMP86_11325 [Gammaproteobacteria bacterium]|nr:hypothetical protein [Gammaproteobacteria bacterium]